LTDNINIFNSGEFAKFKSNDKHSAMKKLYPLYFLSLLILFFGSCSRKKNLQLSKNTPTAVNLSAQQDSLSTKSPITIDSSQQEPIEPIVENLKTTQTEDQNTDRPIKNEFKLLIEKNAERTERLMAELNYLKQNFVELEAKSQFWTDPLHLYNKKIILDNGTNLYGNIIFQNEITVQVETLIGTLSLARESIIRVVDYQVENIEETLEVVDIVKNDKTTAPNNIFSNTLADVVLFGDFLENQDDKKNTILSGQVKNAGTKRADFIKINFTIYKDKSSMKKPKEYTVFISGSSQTFENNLVSDASLMPNEIGSFRLVVPNDFGPFISYSYSIDWEQYD